MRQFSLTIFFLSALIGFVVVPLEAQALTLLDLKQTIVADPGTEQIITIEIKNDSTNTITVEPEVDSFRVDKESGGAVFGARAEAELWVTPEQEKVVFSPGETKRLSFILRIPGASEPGAHYIGLFAKESESGGQLQLGSRVGSLLFLQVSGTQKELLVSKNFSGTSSLVVQPNISIHILLENKGTVQVSPIGSIQLTNMFGNPVIAAPVNKERRTVFSGMSLEETVVFKEIDWKHAGPITVSLVSTYGVTKQSLSDTITIWFIPWQVLSIVLGILFLLSMHILLLKKKKRYTKKKSDPHSFI